MHGIDGTGKSTLSKVVARTLQTMGESVMTYDDYCKQESIVNPFSARKAKVLKEHSIDEQYAFFMSSAVFKSAVIAEALKTNTSIIADRWVQDVHAHHLFAGAAQLPEWPEGIAKPNFTCLLITDESVRQQRIADRDHPTADDLIPKTEGTRTLFFEKYLLESLLPQGLIVDTTNHTTAQSAKLIIDAAFSR
jgi:thymidylate kinase